MRFADGDDADSFAAQIDDKTKGIYVEAMESPLRIPDFEKLSAHKGRASPDRRQHRRLRGLMRPIEHGADVVVESATKGSAAMAPASAG